MRCRVYSNSSPSSTGPDRSSSGGLGIGLALARRLVDMHGGRIEACSEGVGRGSEFTIRLPLATSDMEEARPESSTNPPAVSARRILVVDDVAEVADSLVMLLETLSDQIRVAYDGPSALEIAAVFKPEIVFLDLGMPKMDGFEVARRLRNIPNGRDIFLVALTGWGQAEDRRRTRDAGFDEHLTKPVDFALLEGVLQGRR